MPNYLPEGYREHAAVDLSRNRSIAIALNLAGIALLLVAGALVFAYTISMRPEAFAFGGALAVLAPLPGGGFSLSIPPTTLLGALAAFVLVIIVHELVHGMFFWLFTRRRPVYGLKGLYAYAAAPESYIPRNPFLVVGLAPLVLLTAIGLLLIPFVPAAALPGLVLFVILNASGAVGDLFMVGWLLRFPPSALVRDTGDAISVFLANTTA